MKNNFVGAYAVLGSVVFLIIALASFVGIGFGMFGYFAPMQALPQDIFQKHQSNIRYLKDWPIIKATPDDEEEIESIRKESFRLAIKLERRASEKEMMDMGILFFLSLFLYFYHRRLLRTEQNAGSAE